MQKSSYGISLSLQIVSTAVHAKSTKWTGWGGSLARRVLRWDQGESYR